MWRASTRIGQTSVCNASERIRWLARVDERVFISRADPPASYPRGKTDGGGILADGMGTGKTVEGAAGAFLREILALWNDVPPQCRATLIVAPNTQVMEQ